MREHSLKLRLLLAAALGIAFSLLVAGTAFYFLFQRYAEQLAARELNNDFIQLVSGIRIGNDDKIVSRAVLSDPRFEKPYGGLYWQINEDGQSPLRSRSLFDTDLPDFSKPDKRVSIVIGPKNEPLFAIQRELVLPLDGGAERHLQIMLAVERTDIDQTARDFRRDLTLGLAMLSIALLGGSLIQILLGLRPLQNLQHAVADIRAGHSNQVKGNFPTEVRPLVDNLNQLLNARESALERARQRASNMAHGLKTPLTVLHAIADELTARGHRQPAAQIRDNATLIHDQVERQLARARMASGHATNQTALRPVVERVINALAKTPEGAALNWQNTIKPTTDIAFERADLTELLGNLLDNARKWAKATVRISCENGVLCIEDDGPGVPDAQLLEIEQRGLKLDSQRPGHGLGLSIVRELVESYGLNIAYGRSGLGGLSIAITRPATIKSLPDAIEQQ
jgi:signal transduction histidine kinase